MNARVYQYMRRQAYYSDFFYVESLQTGYNIFTSTGIQSIRNTKIMVNNIIQPWPWRAGRVYYIHACTVLKKYSINIIDVL